LKISSIDAVKIFTEVNIYYWQKDSIVILATWEAEMGRITVQDQPKQKKKKKKKSF
jgi:hypothetical protein